MSMCSAQTKPMKITYSINNTYALCVCAHSQDVQKFKTFETPVFDLKFHDSTVNPCCSAATAIPTFQQQSTHHLSLLLSHPSTAILRFPSVTASRYSRSSRVFSLLFPFLQQPPVWHL